MLPRTDVHHQVEGGRGPRGSGLTCGFLAGGVIGLMKACRLVLRRDLTDPRRDWTEYPNTRSHSSAAEISDWASSRQPSTSATIASKPSRAPSIPWCGSGEVVANALAALERCRRALEQGAHARTRPPRARSRGHQRTGTRVAVDELQGERIGRLLVEDDDHLVALVLVKLLRPGGALRLAGDHQHGEVGVPPLQLLVELVPGVVAGQLLVLGLEHDPRPGERRRRRRSRPACRPSCRRPRC